MTRMSFNLFVVGSMMESAEAPVPSPDTDTLGEIMYLDVKSGVTGKALERSTLLAFPTTTY